MHDINVYLPFILNDFNMQYTNENEISTAYTVLIVFLIINVQKSQVV